MSWSRHSPVETLAFIHIKKGQFLGSHAESQEWLRETLTTMRNEIDEWLEAAK